MEEHPLLRIPTSPGPTIPRNPGGGLRRARPRFCLRDQRSGGRPSSPVQLWRRRGDQVLPHPLLCGSRSARSADAARTHVLADAGHYDFLKPCSADLATRTPAICTSEPGFDRAAFHERFDHDIVAFFKRTLQ